MMPRGSTPSFAHACATDLSARPGVHPHWLFHFRVAALVLAVDAIRSARGTVVGPFTLPTGEQIAVCEDPQGAAFAIRQGSAAAP